MWLVRLHRAFDVYGRDELNRGITFKSAEDRINLVQLFISLDDLRVDPEIWESILSNHSDSIQEALSAAYHDLSEAAYAFNAAKYVDAPRPPVEREHAERIIAEGDRACRKGHDARQALVRLIQQVIAEIESAVPESLRLRFVDSWNHAAYSDVFDPVEGFPARIDSAARRIDSLLPAFRPQLEDVILEARLEFRRINEDIIALIRDGASIYRPESGLTDEQRVLLERRRVLEFERDELIVRTEARLDRLLTTR